MVREIDRYMCIHIPLSIHHQTHIFSENPKNIVHSAQTLKPNGAPKTPLHDAKR